MSSWNYDLLSKEMNLYRDYTQNINMNFHSHKYYEIIIPIRGDLSYLIEKNVYNLNPSDILFINNIEVHKPSFNIPQDSYERIFVHLSISSLKQISPHNFNLANCFTQRALGEKNKISLTAHQYNELNTLLGRIEETQTDSQTGANAIKVALMLQLLIFVNRLYNNNLVSDKPVIPPKELLPILDYIEENIEGKITLEQLENIFYINRFHLSRSFKKKMGINIHEYIILRKISRAKKHLSHGLNVTTISTLCGFKDYTSFIRCFTKVVGISPGKYKKILLQKPDAKKR